MQPTSEEVPGPGRGRLARGYLQADALAAVLAVNTIGPALVSQAFAPLLAASGAAVVVNLTSRRGLLDPRPEAGNLGYAISKAALNMLTVKLADELRNQNIIVVAISPGWMSTDMGGPSAPLTPAQSVPAMLHQIALLGPADSGAVLSHDGTRLVS